MRCAGVGAVVLFAAAQALAQTAAPGAAQVAGDAQQRAVAMAFAGGEGSGTSWMPADTPLFGLHRRAGAWELLLSGTFFAQYLEDAGDRGLAGSGSLNWARLQAGRHAGGGRLGLRAAGSAESWTAGACGVPNLLATGGTCDGGVAPDRQPPRDVWLELAAEYTGPIRGTLHWQVYAGVAGEPALGPASYRHRTSAVLNPLAPVAHDGLDAVPVAAGVVTAGVFAARWKAEASAFNGRRSDQDRTGLDLDALDSFSGRVAFAPAPALVLQVSAGRIEDVADRRRVSASAAYHRRLGAYSVWATTAAWGLLEEDRVSTHAWLVESALILAEVDSVFGRFEVADKTARDLGAGTGGPFTVGKGQAGYTRYLPSWRGVSAGIGGTMSVSVVPEALEAAYGRRVIPGFGVFLTVRGAQHGLPPASPAP